MQTLSDLKTFNPQHINIALGEYDFLPISDKIHNLLKDFVIEVDKNDICFLNIELVNSKDMEYLNKQKGSSLTTDVLSFVFAREGNKVDSCIYIDPLFVSLCIKQEIEFENSFLPQTIDNRIMELINHGILHSTGYDHIDNTEHEKMLFLEKLNLARIFN